MLLHIVINNSIYILTTLATNVALSLTALSVSGDAICESEILHAVEA